jgi:hypothetical protein
MGRRRRVRPFPHNAAQVRQRQVRQRQVRQRQVCQRQVCQRQVCQRQVRQGQVRQGQVRQGQVRQRQVRQRQVRQRQVCQRQVCQRQVSQRQVRQRQVHQVVRRRLHLPEAMGLADVNGRLRAAADQILNVVEEVEAALKPALKSKPVEEVAVDDNIRAMEKLAREAMLAYNATTKAAETALTVNMVPGQQQQQQGGAPPGGGAGGVEIEIIIEWYV